jgi:hypothetical protein
MSGAKRVENRSRNWLAARDWSREGPLPLGIHASSTIAPVPEVDLDELVSGWREIRVQIGSVLGIVDVLEICRPSNLPSALRGNRHVLDAPDNWCWVLGNPRRLKDVVPARGQAWLFNVEVPIALLPDGFASS